MRALGWRERAFEYGREVVTDRRFQVAAALLAVSLFGAFAYFWVQASRMIDAHLAGTLDDTASGVFTAPLTLRAGQPLSKADLVAYLQQLGYTSGADHDGFSGRYAVDGDAITVEPLGDTAGGRFHALKVEFVGETGVKKVTDAGTGERLEEAAVEPLMISSAFGSKEKRIPVDFDAVPDMLKKAVVTTEDRRFWNHGGVDYRGIARAMRENWDEGEVVQGGSTITQQVVKNLFLTPERSYTRKVREAFLAYVLEWKLTKEQIFTLYANEVYLGQSGTYAVHGFAEAARRYFDKDLSQLTLEESALIAGIIHAPNANSPYRHPDRAKERRDLVLDMMAETGAVTAQEADAAKATPIALAPLKNGDAAWLDAPYFNDYVKDYVEERYGDAAASGRMKIDTTLDINLQRTATEVVAEQLAKLDAVLAKGKNGVPPGTVQAALVCMDAKSGAVLAMVGGRDYEKSQLNRATDANRQPGSVFKPFVYATAIASRRVTPATMVMDAPMKFTYGYKQVYEPGNFGDSYANKEIPVRAALKNSKNVPTVEIATQVGLANIAATAERAGLPKPDAYPSMALGTSEATPLEIARAYTAFARGGTGVAPTPVVATERGDSVSPGRTEPYQVFSPQVAYVMTDMLEDVVSSGTGAGVRARGVKGAIAGKTGTSHDGWFVGYTPNMVCAVWVGFDDNRQLGLTGAESALPIWAEFVKKAVGFRPDLGGDAFPRPSGITKASVCDESGLIAGEYCGSKHEEIFIAGTEPSATCVTHAAQYASLTDEVTIPLFDKDGHFIGYGPDTGSSYVSKSLTTTRDRAYGYEEDDDEDGDKKDRKDDGAYQPRRPDPPAVRAPGMIKLPPAHDEDEDEDDE